MRPCWCGNQTLERFSPHYAHCSNCETLVSQNRSTQNLNRVDNDTEDFYGKNYWLNHLAQDFGYPDFFTRAISDLPERCLFWLRTLLKFKLPPAKTLELGSAHGGSVAMLRWAGFDATGLELSPWVVEFSRQTFDIPALLGPIEDQEIEPASLDIISLMDVFEHLPNPAQTMQHCLQLLKPDGLLLIQTPRFPEAHTYEHMQRTEDRFLEQLKHDEHLYLFSESAIKQFFERLGAPHLIFEPAIFAHYDMFAVVSQRDLPVHSATEIQAALCQTAGGRLIRALLDLDDQKLSAHHTFTTKQHELHHQATTLQQQLISQEAAHTQETEALCQERDALVVKQDEQYQEIDQLRATKQHWKQTAHDLQHQVETLQQHVTALETERDIQSLLTQQQQQIITHLRDDHTLRQQELMTIRTQLQMMTHAHDALQEDLSTLTADQTTLSAQLHMAQSKLCTAQQTRIYRLLHRLGRWKFLDIQLSTTRNS